MRSLRAPSGQRAGDPAPLVRGTVLPAFWALAPAQLFSALPATAEGLPQEEAEARLRQYGPNAMQAGPRTAALALLAGQFKSPLVLILIFAAVVSAIVGEWVDAAIILVIVLGSTLLSFIQEYNASNAVERLRSRVVVRANVLRSGQRQPVPLPEIVPGDVVLLAAGSLIPADGVVLDAQDLFVNQAVLTGETFPVEKKPGTTAADAGLSERTNCLFMGTSVTSGTGRLLIVHTGRATVFGQIADRLRLRPPETEFERGIQRFGYMLTQVMLVLVVAVLALNIFLAKPPIDSLLFALALSVGLTPELLPVIIGVTLSHGAQRMARGKVIVRRLNAIENFGSMDVLCTDKTGTLTEGGVRLNGALDALGQASAEVLHNAYLNAHYQTGLANAMDDAIQTYAREAGADADSERKIDEIPYDFVRKRLSVVTEDASGARTLITKGAMQQILAICSSVQLGDGAQPLDESRRAAVEELAVGWGMQGLRVVGLATRALAGRAGPYTRADEADLVFRGFLLFFDPPKPDVQRTIADLAARGVQLKVITGDSAAVARHVAEAVQLPVTGVLTGRQLNGLRDEALWHAAGQTTIFAEVDPNQKERIILALRKMGNVVGYMGDGINDAPALHAADVSISVDTAVDVAKDAADFVLGEKDLGILCEGIDEGRRTFANTLKYVLTTVSANFGNMFSMAGLSVILPFLPLLAPQILLNNFLSDVPATAIAGDNVDAEWIERPHRWNTTFIRNYMVLFGLVSSLFDYATFAVLWYVFHASAETFHTGWFLESLLTELVIALVVRTRRVFWRSRPGRLLLVTTAIIIVIALALPYVPYSSVLGFVPLPAPLLMAVIGLTLLYVLVTELAKRRFYARMGDDRARQAGAAPMSAS
ncbi:MAG: magnesium-translocating P-type ATPase [Chloroflexi bacterium]|nr:magnesium-translocating P-type ATPase [Chloroflexota bacterium]